MGNTSSEPDGYVYESLSPSNDQIIDYISRHVEHNHPQFDPIFIEAIARTVVESKQMAGSFRGYYTYYHEKFITETLKQLHLRQNMRFLTNMILFKIRLKHVVDSFRVRYYQPPDETNPEDKGGVGYQRKLVTAGESFAEGQQVQETQ